MDRIHYNKCRYIKEKQFVVIHFIRKRIAITKITGKKRNENMGYTYTNPP